MQLKINLNQDKNPILVGVITTIVGSIILSLITIGYNMIFETQLDEFKSNRLLEDYTQKYIVVLNRKCSIANYDNNHKYTDKEINYILEPLESVSFVNKQFYNTIKEYLFYPKKKNEFSKNTYKYKAMNLEYKNHDDKNDTITISKGTIFREDSNTGESKDIPVPKKVYKVKRTIFSKNIKIKEAVSGKL